MNIEQRFLQKVIEDNNYVSFSYDKKSYKKVKPLKIENDILKTDSNSFEIKNIKKLILLKEKF